MGIHPDITQRRSFVNIRYATFEWLKTYHWDIAATFTFSYDQSERQVRSTARKFWDAVDHRLYGNASMRFGKKCERIMILEGDGEGQRFHYHAAIILPKDRFDEMTPFCELLYENWCKFQKRDALVDFQTAWSTEGWCRYITKAISRRDCDRLDVHSSHIKAAANLVNAMKVAGAAA